MGEKKHRRSEEHKTVREAKPAKRRKLRQDAVAVDDKAVMKGTSDNEGTVTNSVAVVNAEPSTNGWQIVSHAGGRFLDSDPLFTADEKNLILSLENNVRLYSLATSRAVRSFQLPDDDRITGCTLSPVDSDIAYISTISGRVFEWNWATGEQNQSFKLGGPLLSIQATDNEQVAVFTASDLGKGLRELTVHKKLETAEWDRTVIFESSKPIVEFRASTDGGVVVAVAGDVLIVGNRTKSAGESQAAVKYTWREVTLPIRPTSFDIRDTTPTAAANSKGKPSIDLVVGEKAGSIVIYNDLLNTLEELEKNQSPVEGGSSSRKLHWHRGPVKAVRWSKDGNYLISGGLESVLVLWQLDTGRKQFLPHLPSTICNILVSPSGSNYAVKLDDNSTIVLSTSELRPVASVNGLGIPNLTKAPEKPLLKRKIKERLPSSRPSAILHPHISDYLLLPAPSSLKQTSASASFLQTFDMRSNQQVFRQALARTNISVLNKGPQGTELTTPDIKFVRITSDGAWLATVDEWCQYPGDIDVLYRKAERERSRITREVHLKFWHWNEDSTEWELVSRVNSPHLSSDGETISVIDMEVRPGGYMFCTMGQDGSLKTWVPDRNRRSKSNPTSITSWKSSSSVQLEKSPSTETNTHSVVCSLGFSEDGSSLAVCCSSASQKGAVYLIDPETGCIHLSREKVYTGSPSGCGFLGRYMILLSTDSLLVWDVVADQTKFSSSLGVASAARPLLSINPRTRTFACCFWSSSERSSSKKKKEPKSKPRLAIFGLDSPTPLFQSTLERNPLILLPDVKTGEYIIVDSGAGAHRVSSGAVPATSLQQVDQPSSEIQPLRAGLEDIFGSHQRPVQAGQGLAAKEEPRTNGGKGLTDLFDVGPSFALPSVEVLFQGVVNLFGGHRKL